MQYQEHVPNERVLPFVNRYYAFSAKNLQNETNEKVLPIGKCFMVLQLKGLWNATGHEDQVIQLSKNYIAGQQTYFYGLTTKDPEIDFVGFKLEPTTFWKLTGLDMSTIVYGSLPTEDFFGASVTELNVQLSQILEFEHRFHLMEAFFEALLDNRTIPEPKIDIALAELNKRKGCVSISELANLSFMSQRTLERKFKIQVGVSPQFYCRLIRLVNLHNTLTAPNPPKNIKNLVKLYGFFDQSHLNKEFKAFSGELPTKDMLESFVLYKSLLEEGFYTS